MDESVRRAPAPLVDDRRASSVAPISVSWFRVGDAAGCNGAQRRPGDEAHRSPSRFVTHTHSALAYCTEGSSTFEQDGRWHLSSGDVLVVPAGQPHRRISSDNAAYWGIGVCVPCFASDAELTRLEPFARVREGAAAVTRIPEARRAFFEQLLCELATVTSVSSRSNAQAVQRSLLLLLLNELNAATEFHTDRAKRSSDVVSDSLGYIERNCLQPLTLKEVAAAVGRSPAYVTTALTRSTGKSALGWIISGRMAEARRLLVHSDEPLHVIADRVGYADVTHFIRLFRREHGRTPSAFRKFERVRFAESAGS